MIFSSKCPVRNHQHHPSTPLIDPLILTPTGELINHYSVQTVAVKYWVSRGPAEETHLKVSSVTFSFDRNNRYEDCCEKEEEAGQEKDKVNEKEVEIID